MSNQKLWRLGPIRAPAINVTAIVKNLALTVGIPSTTGQL
jgi:hypothetical protein